MITRKTRYFFLLCSLFVFAVSLFGFLTLYSYKNRIRITNQNKSHLIENCNRLTRNISSEMQNGYININNLASLLGRSLTSEDVDIGYLQTLLSNSIFDFIEFADKDGMDHNITGGVSDARDRKYWTDAMLGYSGMELITKSRATFETLYMFYTPVYFNNEIIGSLIGVYQAKNRLKALLTCDFFGEPAEAYLCTSSGRIVGAGTSLDTTEDHYIQIMFGANKTMRQQISETLETGHPINIAKDDTDVGCYIQRLPGTDFFVVMCFPESVNSAIQGKSQKQVLTLIFGLVSLFMVMGIATILVYARQEQQVEEANNAKSKFLRNMSHDIRTPMNAILGFTELATRHIDEKERVLDYHKKITASSENLLSLINAVLDMSSIESGRIEIKESDMVLSDLIDELVTILQPQFDSKGVLFKVEKHAITNDCIKCDRTHMSQILLNLLSNGLKYTPQGGFVRFTITQLAGSLAGGNGAGTSTFSFTIKDSGVGISKEFLDKLYEPFEREQKSAVKSIQGTGLGLSITKRLLDLMDGTIDVSSRPGFGTEFTVTVTFENSEAALPAHEDKKHSTQSLKGKKILVVDDNAYNLELTSELLRDEGCIVSTAENGLEATKRIAYAQTDDYDLVLMDIQMPVMNGFDASKKIREMNTPLSRVPIIAVSANVFEEDMKKSRESGMSAFVSKPVMIADLLTAMCDITENTQPDEIMQV